MKATNLIDTHCHLNDELYKEQEIDYLEIIDSAYHDGVTKMISVCCKINEVTKLLEMAKIFDFVFCSIGVHPLYVKESKFEDLSQIKNYDKQSDFIAVGECGLDYYPNITNEDKDLQKKFFIEQIRIAIQLNKPIIVHCRDAFEDVYEILKSFNKKVLGVIHCYTGDYEMALKFIGLGFFISFSGILTFKNAKTIKEVAKKINLEHILIETDCPYLSPEPYRGKINIPNNLIFIVQELAKIKKLPLEEIILALEDNTNKLFHI